MSSVKGLVNQATALADSFKSNFLDLARVLRELQDTDADEFKKILSDAGGESRKLYDLIALDRAFEALHIPKSRLQKLGWTKLRHLSKHINHDNAQALLKLAEENTVAKLDAYLRGEDPDSKARTVTVHLSNTDYATYEEAIITHGGIRQGKGFANISEAFMSMVRASTQTPQTDPE